MPLWWKTPTDLEIPARAVIGYPEIENPSRRKIETRVEEPLKLSTLETQTEDGTFLFDLLFRKKQIGEGEPETILDDAAKKRACSLTEKRDFTEEDKKQLFLKLFALLQPKLELLFSPSGILEWAGSFFNFQEKGIKTLLFSNALLLADDMGLGKTIQVISAIRILFYRREIQKVLLAAPASLVYQWNLEFQKWAPELKIAIVKGTIEERSWKWKIQAHVILVSYDTLRSDFSFDPHSPLQEVWDLVVLDEAQKIKNRDASISSICKSLSRCRAWALTGTPLENRLEDLASVLEFVSPKKSEQKPLFLTVGPSLFERHQALQLRRKKMDVLQDLPPKLISEITIPLLPRQRESYEKAEKEGIVHLREKGEKIRIANILELILRLKQICNFCPLSKESSKIQDIKERLEQIVEQGNRALIFSQFVDPYYGVRGIAQELQEFFPLVYTGEMTPDEREKTLSEFKSCLKNKILILSLRTGGQGLNLQEASYVFHMDRWWNPSVEKQAEDRSHRLGQRIPVTVYKYTCQQTIEERIVEILSQKNKLFKQFVDDVCVDLTTHLNAEDLFGLFGLKPGAFNKSKSSDRSLFSSMRGEQFEIYVKDLLEQWGWNIVRTPVTKDGGIDLICQKTDLLGISQTLYVQCKNHRSPIGVEVAREFFGILSSFSGHPEGLLVSPSGFSSEARLFAKKVGIFLWDKEKLQQAILPEHVQI